MKHRMCLDTADIVLAAGKQRIITVEDTVPFGQILESNIMMAGDGGDEDVGHAEQEITGAGY